MPCNGCASKFTVFKSERGCPGCGFGYCSKCLTNEIFVVKINKKAKVCYKCKMSNENGSTTSGPSVIEPPKAYLRRLESLDHPSKPPITVYKQDRLQQLKRGLSEADCEIAERLGKLKDDRIKMSNVPDVTGVSDDDIRERLAKLRDSPMASTANAYTPVVDTRTDQEKSDDLLKQYMEECQISENSQVPSDDIQKRLNILIGIPADAKNNAMAIDDTMSEEDRVIQQVLSKVSDDEGCSDDSAMSSEELTPEEKTSEDESI